MEMSDNNLCNSCTNIGCESKSGIIRTECVFYMPPHLESDNCGNYVDNVKQTLLDSLAEELPMQQESVLQKVRQKTWTAAYENFKAGYEARLKADMVAMLEELQLEIKELWDHRYDVWLDTQYYIGKSDTLEEVDEVIQQKIDKLKGVEDENDNS